MTDTIETRLAAVREEMRRLKLDAFFLQRTDSHGSEYLPADAERVAWLSGFTGSAAMLAVTMQEAAVFSDGRYTLQLKDELDPALFAGEHITANPPYKWLQAKLSKGAVIGYDPMLTKSAERTRLQKVADDLAGSLHAVDVNPVDAAWSNRSTPAISQVFQLTEATTGESSHAKRLRLGQELADQSIDWHILTSADSVAWLLNIRGNDIPFNPLCLSYALLGHDGACRWFVDANKIPDDLQLDNAVQVEPYESFVPTLQALSGKTVSVDASLTHLGFTDAVEAGGGTIKRITDPVFAAKAIKNDVELAGARAAHRRDGAAVCRFLAWLDRMPLDGSVDELAAAQRLHDERAKEEHFRGPSFETITGHGPNGAIVHYRATAKTSRPMTGGSLYLVDSGGQYLDATTDITRTIALGSTTETMRTHYTAVLKGHIQLARAKFPKGTHGGQLDTLARQPLWDLGLDFDHGTGHGIGSFLCVHEGPARIAKAGGTVPLKPGMILSNEPGYYLNGAYGIRLENLVVVAKAPGHSGDGVREFFEFETITRAPFDKKLIDTSLLSSAELAWLNAYHATVFEEVSPRLNDEDRRWLSQATAPL